MDAYQITATFLSAAFYGSYVLKGVLLKRRGVNSNRLAKGDKPKNVRRLEYCLLAATYGMVIVQAVSVYNKLLPSLFEISALRIIGLTAAFAGVVFFIAAIITMKDSWRAGIDNTQNTELIKAGIYKYSRNPAFVGFDLLYIGIALCFPNIINIVLSVCAVSLFHMQIMKEEEYLKTAFGEDYINYMAEVNRYWGGGKKMLEYSLMRSKRKTVALTIDKDLQIIVKAPLEMPVEDIDAFVRRHSRWIKKRRRMMEQQTLMQPENLLTSEQKTELKAQAKEILPQKAAHYGNIMGVTPVGIKITSATTRWGSCSAKNGLCFSYRLMLLPDELIDYIVVHELAHIRVKNHSTTFYDEVMKYMPDYKERQKKLTQIQRGLPK